MDGKSFKRNKGPFNSYVTKYVPFLDTQLLACTTVMSGPSLEHIFVISCKAIMGRISGSGENGIEKISRRVTKDFF